MSSTSRVSRRVCRAAQVRERSRRAARGVVAPLRHQARSGGPPAFATASRRRPRHARPRIESGESRAHVRCRARTRRSVRFCGPLTVAPRLQAAASPSCPRISRRSACRPRSAGVRHSRHRIGSRRPARLHGGRQQRPALPTARCRGARGAWAHCWRSQGVEPDWRRPRAPRLSTRMTNTSS